MAELRVTRYKLCRVQKIQHQNEASVDVGASAERENMLLKKPPPPPIQAAMKAAGPEVRSSQLVTPWLRPPTPRNCGASQFASPLEKERKESLARTCQACSPVV